MTSYLEDTLRRLLPWGNWGAESGTPDERSDWGRLWVHAFLGAVFTAPCFVAVHFLRWWGLLSLLLPLGMAVVREIRDGHPLRDFLPWVTDTLAVRDCKSDIAGCWAGTAVMVPFVLVVLI